MQQELGCHMQGSGLSAHLSYTRKRRVVKQFDASFKHLARLGLFKKSDSAARLYLFLVSLGCSEELPGALWSSGNSMVHVHSKTSSCCSPAQSTLPQLMWYWDTISWATSCTFQCKRKNSHSECKKRPSLFIPCLKCFPTTMRSGSLRLPIL